MLRSDTDQVLILVISICINSFNPHRFLKFQHKYCICIDIQQKIDISAKIIYNDYGIDLRRDHFFSQSQTALNRIFAGSGFPGGNRRCGLRRV